MRRNSEALFSCHGTLGPFLDLSEIVVNLQIQILQCNLGVICSDNGLIKRHYVKKLAKEQSSRMRLVYSTSF